VSGGTAGVAVATRGLTKRYGETVALDGVDLRVREGTVYGLVGPNGAGKTTLLGILAGLRRPTGGDVELRARRIGVLPDTPRFDRWLTATEVVDLARTLSAPERGSGSVAEVLAVAGLEADANRPVRGFSRGMLQRLGLAAAVVGDPDLLLLDEPAAALDPAGRRDVLDLVARMRGRATVIFSSHILEDVQAVCDEVGILRAGQLVLQGPLEELLAGRERAAYVVEVAGNAAAVAAALEGRSWIQRVTWEDRCIVVHVRDLATAQRELPAALGATGERIVAMNPRQVSLEDVFLEVTS